MESMADAPGPGREGERLLSAERHLQALVPGTVLVGGTATALHIHHRVSLDGEHVPRYFVTRGLAALPTASASRRARSASIIISMR